MAQLNITGIVPPLVTPLRGSTQLDREALYRIIEHLIQGGASGLFLLGSTGEWTSLPAKTQQHAVIYGVKGANGRLPVFVNVSDNSLVELRRKADKAAHAGADCVVISPPSYFTMTQDELRKFLEVAIEGTPLPVLLYNAPQYTRTAIAPQTVKALAGHESVLGIKDSSGDLSYLSNLTGIIPARGFSVLVGSEVLLWESHQMGCQGGVCGGANLFPKLYSRFFQSFAEGEPDQTIQIQSLIKRIQEEVYHNFNTPLSHIIGLKYLMEVRGLCRSQMAMPVYRQLYPAQKKSMAALMEEFIALGY